MYPGTVAISMGALAPTLPMPPFIAAMGYRQRAATYTQPVVMVAPSVRIMDIQNMPRKGNAHSRRFPMVLSTGSILHEEAQQFHIDVQSVVEQLLRVPAFATSLR
jgi:hypothetical protein